LSYCPSRRIFRRAKAGKKIIVSVEV